MSVKLMKQRWIVEKMDDMKDSTEIVDMDVDEKDEYEIISEMEKPGKFHAQGGVENEEPKAIGMDRRYPGNIEVKKKPSRWDVGAPFSIQLNDALPTNPNETVITTKCTTISLDKACNEISNKTNAQNDDNEEKKLTNEELALKIVNMKIEATQNAEKLIAAKHENERRNDHVDILLDKIAPPSSDSSNIAQPCDSSKFDETIVVNDDASLLESKHTTEKVLDKGKLVIKWKFTKTPKELPTMDMKNIWGTEGEVRNLSKLHSDKEQPANTKSILECTESSSSSSLSSSSSSSSSSSLETKSTIMDKDELEIIRKPLQTVSSLQHNVTKLPEVHLPSYQPKRTSNFGILSSEPNQSLDSGLDEIQPSENAFVIQKLNKEQSKLNENQETNGNIPETTISCLEHQQNNDDLETTTTTITKADDDDDAEIVSESCIQRTVTSWLESQETKLSQPKSESNVQQWRMNASVMEVDLENEQESVASSSTSSVSMYSFDSTPKTPSSDIGNLQTVIEDRKQLSTIVDKNASDSVNVSDGSSLLPETAQVSNHVEEKLDIPMVESSATSTESPPQPAPYEHLDENIILCDESLIKEAKVVRCFCEPTPEEIAEGRGCSTGCINRELYTECGSRCPSGTGCANRRFHNKQFAKVEIFYAGVKGWGLRAVEPLEPGRFIIEYVGEVIDAEEMIRRLKRYAKDPKHVHHYLMALKNGAVIDATAKGNVSRFINHSCDPNCESQKWAVGRQLRVGFFVIKPIAVGEEIVFDYQLERYGRKAQRCYCGAVNCRGRIGDDDDDTESEEEKDDKIDDEIEAEESETDEEDIQSTKLEVKLQKKQKSSRIVKKRKKQTSEQRYNKMIMNTLSRGPPRNRAQIRDLVRLMVQVEQAPQRFSLIQCIRFAHPDVLRLFIQECGLRLLYVFLATDYPIDDEQSVLQLQIKSLDLLDVMPIVNKNQVNDSHLSSTVEKIARKRGPVDEVVEDVMRRLVNAVCSDMPSTSEYLNLTPAEDPDPVIEYLHCEMVTKAAKLMRKWQDLREEYRIPRRERADSGPAHRDISRYVRKTEEDERSKRIIVDKKDDGSTLWRLSGFGPPPKRRYIDRRRFPKTDLPIFVKDLTHLENEDFKQSPIASTDLTRITDTDEGESKPKKRRSRFDIVGERNPSSMYELYVTDCDSYTPPPPKLLPEAMFAAGLPDSVNFAYQEQPFPEFFDWNIVYAKYDPSSAAYQQFIDYYQQQQYPMMGLPPPCPLTPQRTAEMTNILEAPSPPPPKPPKTPEETPNMLTIGPIDMENPTDEDIEMLEKHLVTLKAKRAEIKKRIQEEKKKAAQELKDVPPPPPPAHTKHSTWVQATTEEGAIYYYNKETRESVWTLPEECEGGNALADTTTDRIDTRATFKAEIVKYVGGMLEPIRKLKFASADDYKYVLRKLTHTILEKELKRVGEMELKVTESVRDKARKFVAEYLARLGDGQYSRKNKISGILCEIVEYNMKKVKIRRTFAENRFYERVLSDWKDRVDDRNFRSTLSRALINLKAYPLHIATFTDLTNIRGIGEQIARKLDGAWNVFRSQNLAMPTVNQIDQMEKGEFLQFLDSATFLEQRSGSRIATATMTVPMNSATIAKSKSTKYPVQEMNVENLKANANNITKRPPKSIQLSKKAICSSEIAENNVLRPVNEPHCSKTDEIRRPNVLNVKSMIDDIFNDNESMDNDSVIDDNDEMEQACILSGEHDSSIIYHPSTFDCSQVILIVDNRESANTRKFQRMCNLFQKKGIIYELHSLSVGDYLWIIRMSDGTEMVLDYIVERKTHDDLWSSIKQKRYEEQKQRLMSVGIPNIVYILEGSVIPEPALEQALVTTHIENRFLVYRTNNIEHTSLILSKITERLKKRASFQELTGMSFKDFQKTSKKTQLRSVKDIFLRQLTVCPQISVQKALLVVDRFPSFAALTDFYASLPKEQRAMALSEIIPGITKAASSNMAKFYAEV